MATTNRRKGAGDRRAQMTATAGSTKKGTPAASGRRTAGRRRTSQSNGTKPGKGPGTLRTNQAASPTSTIKGGRLRNEIAVPLGLGALVLVAILGIVAGVAAKSGTGVVVVLVAATGTALAVGLVGWVLWMMEGAIARPLTQLREALQQMEEGDYGARLQPEGAAELREIAVGFNRMVTIASHQRERLKQLAATDPLTGLANHRHFHERQRAELDAARESKSALSVVALDLDDFKKLNDNVGHARGDELLRTAATALRKAVREVDLVGRLESDDFMLLLLGADSGYARDVADRARDAIRRALGREFDITVSAGFVSYPDHVRDDSNLAELATSALELAKRAGGDQTQRYDAEQVAAIPTIKQQRGEIDALLELPEPVTTHYQPVVELTTGRIVGFEALARFNSDVKRPPDAWFNQAHACGRGTQLEATAIQAALACGGRPEGSYLALNFSPSAIASTKVIQMLPLRLAGIVIEVTEHELAAEDSGLEEGLARLRRRGAKIAVDDAGAGYAGLNQVMRVQPDMIKLDRSLVQSVHEDAAKRALIELFVLFARRVGAAVCTEGIETIDELRALVNLGVGYGQGYLLGRPAEPWTTISAEIARALATGALRTHVQATAVPVPAKRKSRVPPALPVNRRLARYQNRGY